MLLDGDHSISAGSVRAINEVQGTLSSIQIDAHADLRNSYQSSKLNHACAMVRIRELAPHTLQIGIRSMSSQKAQQIEREGLCVCTIHEFRHRKFGMDSTIANLPGSVSSRSIWTHLTGVSL